MRDIGKNIKSIRQEKNMTQEALADALYVTRQTVSNYENGRSRPDLDTLLKIAEILDTDINTIIYGPPVPQSKMSAYKWAIVTCGIAFLIFIVNAFLEPFLREVFSRTYRTDILLMRYLNKEIIMPVAMFFLGWTLCNWLSMFSGLRQLQGQNANIGKIILLVLGGIVVLVPLPFYIWQYTGAVRSLLYSSASTAFPHIPVYHEILQGILFLTYKTPILYCVMGDLFWLFGIPKMQTQKDI